MRELVLAQKDILLSVEKLERRVGHHDEDIVLILRHLRVFESENTTHPKDWLPPDP